MSEGGLALGARHELLQWHCRFCAVGVAMEVSRWPLRAMLGRLPRWGGCGILRRVTLRQDVPEVEIGSREPWGLRCGGFVPCRDLRGLIGREARRAGMPWPEEGEDEERAQVQLTIERGGEACRYSLIAGPRGRLLERCAWLTGAYWYSPISEAGLEALLGMAARGGGRATVQGPLERVEVTVKTRSRAQEVRPMAEDAMSLEEKVALLAEAQGVSEEAVMERAVDVYLREHPVVRCPVCGKVQVQRRAGHFYCGNTCRVRAYRARLRGAS